MLIYSHLKTDADFGLKLVELFIYSINNFFVTAIKEIQSEIHDMPLFQFNSPERDGTTVLQDTVPLAAELEEMSSETFPIVPTNPRDTLLYIYTSGTTGFPKAAIITNIRYT